MHRLAILLTGTLLFPGPAQPAAPAADSFEATGNEVLQRYLQAVARQAPELREVSMESEISANIPYLERKGTLSAERRVSKDGRISYKVLGFEGDDSVKKDVIARYMHAEVEASAGIALGITPENYKFKYRGVFGAGDWRLHLYELSPKQKLPGLFKGWLWVEARTALPVREEGTLVKSPSVFLKKVDFVRDYEISGDVARPSRMQSKIMTRLVGLTEVNVRYRNYVKKPDVPVAAKR